MSTGAVIAIVVVIVVVIAVVAVVAMEMRRRKLRRQFGPEYDRLVTELGSRRKAEAELSARQRRVAKLDIRPLTREETARYLGEWNAIQERFVDTPGESVEQASVLVTAVMRLRGYPADDQNEAMEALSVEHGPTLSRYREARLTSERARLGSASTDDLRNAMLQYRALFEELAARPQRDSDAPADAARPADGVPPNSVPPNSVPRRTGRAPATPYRLSAQREGEMMPRNQETSIDQAPPASSDPVDAAGPAPEGEWVAGSRGPSATVPSQPGDPFAEDVRDDPGTRATPPFGEQATPAAGEDRGPAGDTTPLGDTTRAGDTTPAGDTMSTADTTPAVDADSDPSVATPPAMDADASRATETRSGRGTLPATDGARLDQPTGTLPPTDTAQLDQPATGAHAAPASAPGGAAAGLDAAGAAFVTDADGYRASWVRIQSGFVDDPHGAVTEASGLITQVTSTLVSAVQERERSLRGGWESGGADTEVLRNALREYRSFFERLMKV